MDFFHGQMDVVYGSQQFIVKTATEFQPRKSPRIASISQVQNASEGLQEYPAYLMTPLNLSDESPSQEYSTETALDFMF